MKRIYIGVLCGASVLGLVFFMYLKRARNNAEDQLIALFYQTTQALEKKGFIGGQAGVFSFTKGSRLVILGDIYGESITFQERLQVLELQGLVTKDFDLMQNTYLLLNGNCLGDAPTIKEMLLVLKQLLMRNPGKVFLLRGPSEELLPFKKYKDLNKHEYPALERALQDLYSRLLVGAYIFAEDLTEVPLRIVPTGRDTEQFSRIFCEPVVGQEPLRALCRLGELCSYEEGTVRTLMSKSYSCAIITLDSTLEKSSVSFFVPHEDKPVSTKIFGKLAS